MKGHIRPRGKDSWQIQICIGRKPNGNPKYAYRTVHGGIKTAYAERNKMLAELQAGEFVKPAKGTVAEYLERWLESAKATVAPKTAERYAQIVHNNVLPRIGQKKLSDLDPATIQKLYSDALKSGRCDGTGGLSAESVLYIHRVLHKALRDAVMMGILARNPCDAVTAPRTARKQNKVIEADDMPAFLQALEGSVFYLPALLAMTTGLRRGEILGLKWEHIDFKRKVLYVEQSLSETDDGIELKETKTGALGAGTVDLPAATIKALKEHKALQEEQKRKSKQGYIDQGFVCAKSDGSPRMPDAFSRNWVRVLKQKGLAHIQFKCLRDSHATALLKRNVHPRIVQERLRHNDIRTTMMRYSHVMPSMQRGAADEMDDMLG